MDRRRSAIAMLAFAVLATSTLAEAQPSARRPRRLGVLGMSNPVAGGPFQALFADELAKLGWVEGQNLQSIYRYADGDAARMPALAAELVALEPDVLFATNLQASLVLAHATSRIPVVMTGPDDPIAFGLVKSIAHPGGNVTGTASGTAWSALSGKRLEILKELLPRSSRLAVIYDAAETGNARSIVAMSDRASQFGMRIEPLSARDLSEIRGALDVLSRNPPDAIYVFNNAPNFTNKEVICMEALRMRVPTMTNVSSYADSGCLASYAYSIDELALESARFVDQILRGAKPADIPVRQPTRFEFVINARTAASLGLTIPPKLRVMADRVIE
jgi:putative ABC transport system substrate-binding protein